MQPYLIPSREYLWLSDMEIERRLSQTITTLPEVFESTALNRQEAKRAKRNWNYWFRLLNGRELLRSHHYRGHILNHDVIHQCLHTESFNDLNGAGVCVDRQEAKRYVENQLVNFIRNQ